MGMSKHWLNVNRNVFLDVQILSCLTEKAWERKFMQNFFQVFWFIEFRKYNIEIAMLSEK